MLCCGRKVSKITKQYVFITKVKIRINMSGKYTDILPKTTRVGTKIDLLEPVDKMNIKCFVLAASKAQIY